MKKPTIKDVAALAFVSTALVSRVMNAPRKPDGTPDCVVHPDTAKRILNAVAQLGYHPNKAAVSLRKELSKRIGVIIPDIANPFFADIARHIESVARKKGYIVLFGSTDENPEQLGTLAEAFMEDGVDGLIITPGTDCYNQVQRIVSQAIPVVIIIRDIAGIEGVGKVLTDDGAATELALNHLVSQGYSSIDMISPLERLSIVKNREKLFSGRMDALNLKYKIHHDNAGNDLENIKLILEDAVRRNVQAIYCISARIPLRVLQASREMGIRIPEDIALFGYDGGTPYKILSPSISQIEFSREEIAEEAFGQLLDIMTKSVDRPGCRFLKPILVPGESSCKSASRGKSLNKESEKELMALLSKASIAINDVIKEVKNG